MKNNSIREDAYAVLLPAFDGLELSPAVRELLESGCVSVLLGESRSEYVARTMSDDRKAGETAGDFLRITEEVRTICGSAVVAVDQEIGGILRLHNLVPDIPTIAEAASMSSEDLAESCRSMADAAKRMGINLFLAPIADILTGTNDWLKGRTPGSDAVTAAKIVIAYIKGVQAAGIGTSLKHFPGYPSVTGDPAVEEALCNADLKDIKPVFDVFSAGIAAGTRAVMLGPAIVQSVDPAEPASTSAKTVGKLKKDFCFDGLVISDDLDAPGILLGRSLKQTAVDSLSAGADLLLLSAGPHLHAVVDFMESSVENNKLNRERLGDAAAKVRALAAELQ